jgi:hypothetical protein
MSASIGHHLRLIQNVSAPGVSYGNVAVNYGDIDGTYGELATDPANLISYVAVPLGSGLNSRHVAKVRVGDYLPGLAFRPMAFGGPFEDQEGTILDLSTVAAATLQMDRISAGGSVTRVAPMTIDSTANTVTVAPFIRLSGADGGYVSTPDSAPLSITGDMGMTLHFTPRASDNEYLVSKWADGQEAWRLSRQPGGALYFEWGDAGSFDGQFTVHLFADDEDARFGLALDTDFGAFTSIIYFFYSLDGGATWIADSAHPLGYLLGIDDTTAPLIIGGQNAGIDAHPADIYSLQIFNGIGTALTPNEGTAVVDLSVTSTAGGTIVDAEGNVWTLNGDAVLDCIDLDDPGVYRMSIVLEFTSGRRMTVPVHDNRTLLVSGSAT